MYHIAPGDLVRYTAVTIPLVGVVVSIDDITGRAKVYLQNYGECKNMELKFLMKVRKND